MLDRGYLNARADQCSATTPDGDKRIVRHGGQEYTMVGLYFARSASGQRELYYILRMRDGQD